MLHRLEPRHVSYSPCTFTRSFTSVTYFNYRLHQSTRATAYWINRFLSNFERLCVCVVCTSLFCRSPIYRYTSRHLFTEIILHMRSCDDEYSFGFVRMDLLFSQWIQASWITAVWWHTCFKRFLTCNTKGFNMFLCRRWAHVGVLELRLGRITSDRSEYICSFIHDKQTDIVHLCFNQCVLLSNAFENERVSLWTCAL